MNISTKIKIDLSGLWNDVSERFNTHKPLDKVHPDAAVNIHIGWPIIFQQIDYQIKYLGKNHCRIFDFGCGAGGLCQRLHRSKHLVVGLDHSEGMLSHARKHLPQDIELIHGNHHSPIFNDSKYKGTFDIVLAMHSMECVEDIEIALHNLSNLLKPGGIILFAVYPKAHVIDSLKIKDLFEDFDSMTDPYMGYENFDGIRIPMFIRDASFFDNYFNRHNFEKVLETYPAYPKAFLDEYKWTGSLHPEMMILSYRKK